MQNEILIEEIIRKGEIALYPYHQRTSKKLKFVGLSLIVASFSSLIFLVYPMVVMEFNWTFLKPLQTHTEVEKASAFGGLIAEENPLPQPSPTPVVNNFILQIPKIGVDANVFPNVDPENKTEYLQYLKAGVAHAKGTSFPNELGTTYIFGHSSTLPWDRSQQPIFYLLKNLGVNDEIDLIFNGKQLTYKVTQTATLGPNEIPDFISQTEKKLLVLQTCWPPGTAWKRLYIIAEPMEANSGISSL